MRLRSTLRAVGLAALAAGMVVAAATDADAERQRWKLASSYGSNLDVFGENIKRTLANRSEEHTSELQSLMRISYAVFCLKKKKNKISTKHQINSHTQSTITCTLKVQKVHTTHDNLPMQKK